MLQVGDRLGAVLAWIGLNRSTNVASASAHSTGCEAAAPVAEQRRRRAVVGAERRECLPALRAGHSQVDRVGRRRRDVDGLALLEVDVERAAGRAEPQTVVTVHRARVAPAPGRGRSPGGPDRAPRGQCASPCGPRRTASRWRIDVGGAPRASEGRQRPGRTGGARPPRPRPAARRRDGREHREGDRGWRGHGAHRQRDGDAARGRRAARGAGRSQAGRAAGATRSGPGRTTNLGGRAADRRLQASSASSRGDGQDEPTRRVVSRSTARGRPSRRPLPTRPTRR